MKSIGIHKYKLSLIPLSLVALTLLSGYFLSHEIIGAHAETSTASVTVGVSCNMSGEVTKEHTATIINGQAQEDIGTTKLTTMCNDTNGYGIYAVGFSDDTYGNTNMLPTTGSTPIATGTWATSGTSSVWNMKITKDTSSFEAGNLSIVNNFNANHAIPDVYTKIANYTSNTDEIIGSSVFTTYSTYVAQSQPADTYIGKVKYVMVHPSSQDNTVLDMQDLTLASCSKNVVNNIGDPLLVRDVRDDNFYTVRYINGNCWMTQNLRFTGTTLTPSDSNVATDTTMTYYSLDSSDDNYYNNGVAMCDATNGYNNACIKDSGNPETGVWYNFAAASAGTITSSSNTTPATSDVCPKGWHLPSGPASTTGTDFYGLFQNTTWNVWIDANNYLRAFNAVSGGRYSEGLLNDAYGHWWSADGRNETARYYLAYDDSSNQFISIHGYRGAGSFVRCIFGNS